MSIIFLPGLDGPNDERRTHSTNDDAPDSGGEENSRRTGEPRRDDRDIPDERACLRALAQLPGLLAVGLISTQRANSIRGVYQTMLVHHQKNAAQTDRSTLADADLKQILKESPKAINLLEPLLTAEQLDWLMSDDTEANDEQT